MKYSKILFAAACLGAVCFTGCKNDRADDSHMDTTTVATTPVPYEGQSVPAASTTMDSMIGPDSTSSTAAVTVKTEPTDTRTRKTSRKGRIILASYKNTSTDKIAPDRDGIYNRAEIMPSYPGGENELANYIANNIEYPQRALDNDVQGTVKVFFAVDEQGKIYAPTVISSKLGYGLEEEALRVISRMPKWSPGQIKGKNVKTRFSLPITYQIE